jgi:hypothetical protein
MSQSQTTLDLIARVDPDGSCFYEHLKTSEHRLNQSQRRNRLHDVLRLKA